MLLVTASKTYLYTTTAPCDCKTLYFSGAILTHSYHSLAQFLPYCLPSNKLSTYVYDIGAENLKLPSTFQKSIFGFSRFWLLATSSKQMETHEAPVLPPPILNKLRRRDLSVQENQWFSIESKKLLVALLTPRMYP